MSISSKNTKNIKIQDQIRLKKKKKRFIGTLTSWNFKQLIDNLNFGQTLSG